MQSWTQLQRELLPQGYVGAVYVGFTCSEGHGYFRSALHHLTRRCPCPTCGLACWTTYLGVGITRLQLPLVEQASAAELKPYGLHELKHLNRVPRRLFERKAPRKLSRFERQVQKLRLTDEESLVKSVPLRAWAAKHKHLSYVPESLLARWGLPVSESGREKSSTT